MNIFIVSKHDIRVRYTSGAMMKNLNVGSLVATLRKDESDFITAEEVRCFATLKAAQDYALNTPDAQGNVSKPSDARHWVVFSADYSGGILENPDNDYNNDDDDIVELALVKLKTANLTHVDASYPEIDVSKVVVKDAIDVYIKAEKELIKAQQKAVANAANAELNVLVAAALEPAVDTLKKLVNELNLRADPEDENFVGNKERHLLVAAKKAINDAEPNKIVAETAPPNVAKLRPSLGYFD